MKYIKPEIELKALTSDKPIADGLDGWMTGSEYEDAKDYVTDFALNS